MPSTLLANLKQLPDPQANRERPPVWPLHRGQACGLLLFPSHPALVVIPVSLVANVNCAE
jgi:hypothetical protein